MLAKQRRGECKIAQKLASGSLEGERADTRHYRYCGSRGRTGQGLIPGVCRNKEEEEKGLKSSWAFFHITSRKPVVF